MKTKWKFKAVRDNQTEFYMTQDNQAITVGGSETDAVEFARHLRLPLQLQIRRVDIESEGPIADSNLTLGSSVCYVKERHGGSGWVFEDSEHHHAFWHPNLAGALNYASYRMRGRLSEIQVLDSDGSTRKFVLMDQTNLNHGIRCSPG